MPETGIAALILLSRTGIFWLCCSRIFDILVWGTKCSPDTSRSSEGQMLILDPHGLGRRRAHDRRCR
jgi:hypothetical protein